MAHFILASVTCLHPLLADGLDFGRFEAELS